MKEMIDKVLAGADLDKEELAAIVGGYLSGSVSKEEMTGFLRAVCERGLSERATIFLTEVMLESGERLSFTPREYPYADKHSTGGLADSTTLIVAPVVASCGVPFLKMSGRKLGHTGGTIDKLEHFKGLRTEMSVAEAESIVAKTGVAVIAQSKELVPADKAMYKLRDETNTVKSLPLIASSVISKKLASGADVFALDVKTGSGAFMETVEGSIKLAELMVKILVSAGKKAAAVISDMDSPLGDYVGGVLEVADALDVLDGKKGRLYELSMVLATRIIALAKGVSFPEAEAEARDAVRSGRAKEKLAQMVSAQGGETSLFDGNIRAKYRSTPLAEIRAEGAGYLSHIDCVTLGFAARDWENRGGYGIYAPRKVGDRIEKGDLLFALYGDAPQSDDVTARLRGCATISEDPVAAPPLVHKIVG